MPYTRSEKCVYKKKADGSRGKKKGCSDTEEKAKKYMSKLYSLDETDLDETDPMFLGGGAPEEEVDPMGEAILREWVRMTLLSEASLGGKTGLFKYKSRARKVRDKIVNGEPLALAKGIAATGETFVIVRNKDQIVQALNDIMAVHDSAGGRAATGNGFAEPLSSDPLYKRINDLLDQSAEEIGGLSLGRLHKSLDLGGKEPGESVACEDQQIAQMQTEIDKLKPLSIKLGSIVVDDVAGIVSIPSTPKADAALINSQGNQIAWISLKCANSGKDMQQWGGISEQRSSDITQFVKDLVAYMSVNGRLTKVMWRRIQDPSLAKRAVWGLEAGSGEFGVENVHTVISTKGQIGLSEISDGLYEFTVGAGEVHHGGAMPTGTFEPMLAATYRSERGAGLGLTDVRVGVYSAAYRSMMSKGMELPTSAGPELEVIPLEAQDDPVQLADGRKIKQYAKSQVRLMETRRYAKSQVGLLKERLIIEELTGSDRSEIKRMIKKEIEGTTNKREIERAFNKKFDVELKKALGASFFSTPGKINKFVVDQIYDEVNKWLADTATRNEIADITKQVLVKLYRELSFSSPTIIKRIKV